MQFRNIIGQEEIKKRLIHSVHENRISHAQLFLAPEGSGGLALAMAYAQYIFCKNKSEHDSCGECPACLKCQKLVHPDLHLVFPITPSADIKTSDSLIFEFRAAFIRDPYLTLHSWFNSFGAENKNPIIPVLESASILRKLSLTTFEGGYKIMIIWLPEKMNIYAANKLLKILEEPPDKTLFLLVTEQEDQLLRTIVSRTQLISIQKISDSVMSKALQENYGLSEEDSAKWAFLSDGNYSAAERLHSDNESGDVYLRLFQLWMRACLKFDGKKIIDLIDNLAALKREKQKEFLTYAIGLMRECLMMNYADDVLIRLRGEELDFVQKFARFIHAGNCEQFIESMNQAVSGIERNAAAKILFMDLSFKANELLNREVPV